MKVLKGTEFHCPHCNALLAKTHRDFEFKINHSFEGCLYRLGFTYDTVDWVSGERTLECMSCGKSFDVIDVVDYILKKK
jgi:transcription elongation factor Elf1